MMRLPVTEPGNAASIDIEKTCEMVDKFLEEGFTYFDTAYMYHEYQSEVAVRKALVERHERSSYLLASKLPTMMLKEPGDMERIFSEQLEKCGVEYFDYYLLHCLHTSIYEKMQEMKAFEFCMEKKRQGKIKKLGFSFHDKADVLDRILTDHPEMEFVQLQINYLDWENAWIQSRLCYEVARKHGKPIVVMEPVRGGALANVPGKAERIFKEKNEKMSVASWAVRFAASHDGVFMVLSGMSNMQQLQDNISYMKDFAPLNEEEKELAVSMADIINAAAPIGCTACRYCVEGCPKGIAIPELFTLYNEDRKAKGDEKEGKEKDYAEFVKSSPSPLACISCGQCEKHCPQHLKVIDLLRKVAGNFEV